MSDAKMIEGVARYWLENGGDAEGFNWTMFRILTLLRDTEREQTLARLSEVRNED